MRPSGVQVPTGTATIEVVDVVKRYGSLAAGKTFAVSGMHPRLRALATLYGVGELLPATD